MSNQSTEDNRIAWLTLKLLPGLGNRSILWLLKHFKAPEQILEATSQELSQVRGLRPHAITILERRKPLRDPHAEWDQLQRQGIRLVCINDPDYPANLAAITDPPAVLFLQGTLEPRDLVAVAVVGSRAASLMGISFTERLCADLAARGITVVSGLAVGIDGAAHRGALQAQGRTIAVLGCGLDVDYPQANTKLRRRIGESGALLTEFALGTQPEPGHFPARNRIISGLALGVVVVEAAERSGSLITARLALEQGREVFAVPGLARHYRSIGPHRLLRQGAKLVESADDILEEIGPLIRPSWRTAPAAGASRREPSPDEPCSAEEISVLGLLDRSPLHIDEIGRGLSWPASRVATVLLALELKGKVQQLPGKFFSCRPN